MAKIAAAGCRVYFGSCEKIGDKRYKTRGNSRAFAVANTEDTPWGAKANIATALKTGFSGNLEYRNDVGDKGYIMSLASRVQ